MAKASAAVVKPHSASHADTLLAGELDITYFGTSAPFPLACRKAAMLPRELVGDRLRGLGSTGAPPSSAAGSADALPIAEGLPLGSLLPFR
ncbi:hypothetical protein [Luedemannella helvata]|uniref:Uncharacterized protein n=1 Tax=Luedemannella helvata TaxID=349315 RepID=A0ABN2JR05_9ACTN